MATTAHPAAAAADAASERLGVAPTNPLILWHLLSLDAPTVAMLWTWFLARANHVHLPPSAIQAMGLAVWMLYAADRLLDVRLTPEDANGLEPRHHFHRHHRRGFRIGICLASFTLAALLPGLATQSLRLYLVLGALLFAYFILIHAGTFPAHKGARRLPKELAVGLFFAAAVFIPTIAREPSLRIVLLPDALLFAAVCSINCLFIYKWEHPGAASGAHPLTQFALRCLTELALAAALSCLILGLISRQMPWPIPAACAASSAFLLTLDRHRHRLSPTTLRAAADLCLLTPLLLLPLL